MWREQWHLTYAQEIQKFLTFKTKSRDLKVGDVVLITDHRSPGGYQTFGQVSEVLSDRTMKLQYVKKQAKYNTEGKLLKKAKLSFLIRPVQNLVYLTSSGEEPATLDPFMDKTATSGPSSPSTPTEDPAPSNIEEAPDVSDPEEDVPDGDPAADTSAHDDSASTSTSTPTSTSTVHKPRIKVTFIPEAEQEIRDLVKVKPRKRQNKKKNN